MRKLVKFFPLKDRSRPVLYWNFYSEGKDSYPLTEKEMDIKTEEE